MSVLDRDFQDTRPPAAQRTANDLLRVTKQTFEMMAHAFNEGSQQFWDNNDGATPQEIADVLGTDAKEVFELHAQLGAFLAGINPESVTQGLSYVGNIVYNEDGTVQVSK